MADFVDDYDLFVADPEPYLFEPEYTEEELNIVGVASSFRRVPVQLTKLSAVCGHVGSIDGNEREEERERGPVRGLFTSEDITAPSQSAPEQLLWRNAILIVNALSVVGASLMFMSKATASFEVLIVGRLIFGLFCGLVMSLNPLYIQGVSPTNLRGAFATLNQVSFASGILLGMVVGLETVLGTEKYWSLMLSLSLIPATLQYMSLPFCPESPRYLFINRGKEKEAEAALRRLRGNPEMVMKEMEEMREEAAHSETGVTVREFLRKRRYRQPIILVLIINLGSQLSGFNAIINYSTKMFAQSNFDEAKYLTLGVGAVNVAFTIVAFFLVERAGRRKLLLAGFLSLVLCNLFMTITYSILTIIPDIRNIQVLVVFFLISAYEVGPGPISWFIAAELFDQSARPIAMAFTSMLNWGGKFLLALLFPPLLKICGAYVYLLFMCMALLAFTYTMFRLPETKGRTFDDIAAEFRGAEGIPLHNKTTFNTFN
ncbi:Solute carrier family 2, facilitated glucose transporter member 3 [Anabarilius grahami]|uniref:Solute carrier family 2, facilitated glucose transporter member 3 n=1 Tax=Anabarilius grahami TaxID=495550 RepID=A0A3N0XSN7_ANAGA|nr:Solute carrier family 2, facilitated glucose transporter member 3 [Anabarilius grahami]